MDYCVIHGGYSNSDTLLKQREAEKGFRDNVPKQGMGQPPHRNPVPIPERSKKQESGSEANPDSAKASDHKREATRGRGNGWDAVPDPVRNLMFLNLPLHGLLRNPWRSF